MNRKKLIITIVVSVIATSLIFFAICLHLGLSNYDFNEGKRPHDMIGSVWVSDEPYMVFTVDKNQHCVGMVGSFNNQVYVSFKTPGKSVDILELNIDDGGGYSSLLSGNVKSFNEDSFTIVVDSGKGDDLLFNGKYETLTFERQSSASNIKEQTTCYFCDKRSNS